MSNATGRSDGGAHRGDEADHGRDLDHEDGSPEHDPREPVALSVHGPQDGAGGANALGDRRRANRGAPPLLTPALQEELRLGQPVAAARGWDWMRRRGVPPTRRPPRRAAMVEGPGETPRTPRHPRGNGYSTTSWPTIPAGAWPGMLQMNS